MEFYIPKIKNASSDIYEEYCKRTELVTRFLLAERLTKKERTEYIDGIIEEADLNKEYIFWSIEGSEDLSEDFDISYIYEPTYYVVAFMIYSAVKDKDLLLERTGFIEALYGGMKACTLRDFRGKGENDTDNYIRKIIDIFEKANTDQFFDLYSDFCPEFSGLYMSYKQYFSNKSKNLKD